MASNVEEHVLRLRDNFSGKLSGVTGKVHKFRGGVEKMQGSLSALGGLASRIFAGVAVGAAVKQVVTLGVEMEQTRLLLAAGIEADGVTKHLKAIGDVAAGSNVPITELTAIFQKGFSKGKIQGEQLDQFAERGINIIPELAKAMGVAEDAVRDLGSKGKITRDHLVLAFQNMSSEGGTFFDLMKKQSATVGGRFSTLIGKLQLTGIEIGEKLLPVMGQFVDVALRLGEILKNNTDGILVFGKWVVKAAAAFALFKIGLIAANIAMKVGRIAMVAYRIAVVALKRGVISAIRSLKAMRIALATSGLGLLAIALVEIASSFISFGDEVGGATEQLDEFGNKIDEVTAKAGKNIFEKQFQALLDPFTAGVLGGAGINKFTNELKGLTKIQLQAFKLFLEEEESNLNRIIANLPEGLQKIGKQTRLKGILRSAGLVKAELAKLDTAAGGPSGTTGSNLKSGLATVRSGAPKNITINIDSLIEEQVFNTADLKESASRVKDAVTRVLLEALNDAQIIAR